MTHRSSFQTSRLGLRQDRSTLAHERVEPQHPGGLVRRRAGRQRAVEAERAGQEVDAQVAPDAGAQQVLDLLVGLVAGQLLVEVEHHQPWGAQPDPTGQLGHHHLGDQHPQALAGATELADVGAEVLGLHDAGQAAALAQRGDVAGDGDARQRRSTGSAEEVTGPAPRRATAGAAPRRRSSAGGQVGARCTRVSRSSRPDGQVAVPLLVAGHDVPGRDLGVGALQRRLVGRRGTRARAGGRRCRPGRTSSACRAGRAA